jgi:hypothetical protein
VVTILQEEVDDTYRGRIFAFYDMMFNAAYVAGAALSVVIMPVDGHSPILIALVAAGFAVVAAGYWLALRRDQAPSGPSGSGSGGADASGGSGGSEPGGSGPGGSGPEESGPEESGGGSEIPSSSAAQRSSS